MAKIRVYRNWTVWENEGDDEPTTVKESEETYDCVPDEIDRSEGLTVVDLAVAVLETKLYVTEPSSSPGFHPGIWYSACLGPDHSWGMGGADEDLTAHLEGFNEDELRAIWKDLAKRNNWR
jgi:hypothetical protein